jgi:hypothetical protein
MRPRTKLPIPEPTGTEFDNFDRLTGILLKHKPTKIKTDPKAKPSAKTQERGRPRLPRP